MYTLATKFYDLMKIYIKKENKYRGCLIIKVNFRLTKGNNFFGTNDEKSFIIKN